GVLTRACGEAGKFLGLDHDVDGPDSHFGLQDQNGVVSLMASLVWRRSRFDILGDAFAESAEAKIQLPPHIPRAINALDHSCGSCERGKLMSLGAWRSKNH